MEVWTIEASAPFGLILRSVRAAIQNSITSLHGLPMLDDPTVFPALHVDVMAVMRYAT